MKIGIVSFNLNYDRGSMYRYTKNLIENLNKINKEGDEVVLITNQKTNFENRHYLINYNPKIKRIWQFSITKKINKGRFDVIHYPDSMPLNIGNTNAKVVFTIHGIADIILPRNISKTSIVKYYGEKLLWKYLLNQIDIGITVSKSEKNEIKKHIGINNVRVVYHGLEKKFKKLPKNKVNKVLRKYKLEYKKYIFHISDCRPKKNIEGLIKSMKYINSTLIISGKINEKTKKRITQLSEKEGVKNKIKILGFIKEADLPAIYNGAILTLYPSFHESFGFPIIESMGCGTPVVTSNVYSMPEVGGKAGVYVNPYDPEDIGKKVKELLENKKYRHKKEKESLKRAKQFSWKKCAKKTLEIYHSVK